MDINPVPAGLPKDYQQLLSALKVRIRAARVKAALAVNCEMIALYWHIGGAILERRAQEGWGMSTVRRLSRDFLLEFPAMRGLSPKNIWRMRAFYLAWSVPRLKVAQDVRLLGKPMRPPKIVASLPWGQNIVLFQKLKDPVQRLWYARQTAEHGWSRNVLSHQIESGLYSRQGAALTNFKKTLPSPQSDLAQETIKDDYVFDFLASSSTRERDLERGLLDHVQRLLLELGTGFALVSRQHWLEVGGEEFYIDLLFYHLRLRCFVVVELKAGPFKPEHAGKMSFYLAAADDLLRQKGDRPSVGLILCRSKNRIVAEYALRDMRKPIGISSYRLTRALPEELRKRLPTTSELEDGLR